jgi:S-formylglutathione hydrolase FrmB
MNPNKKFFILTIIAAVCVIFISSVLFFIPGFTQKKAEIKKTVDTTKATMLPKHDTLLSINDHPVFIKICGGKKKGTFLVLHGWNLPAEDWCNKTSLCEEVLKLGFCVVLPDMGKSVYQQKDYPETRNEWRMYPTREWLTDTLIPLLQQKYSLLSENENNYLAGLSTGARGVALVLLDLPSLFKGAAALSGDYDQLKMPADNLMTGYYGPIKLFKDRWENTDNPMSRIKEFNTPIYLGHGKLDKVVPPEQTLMFYDSLKKYHPALKIKLNMPDAQHDYQYWGSEVENMLKFFELK